MVSVALLSERALKSFSEGYNCSQSVLLTFAEHWKCKDESIPKIATCFGAGIGRCGSLCGALTGGLMVIGMKYGTNEASMEKRLDAYELAKEFYERFKKKHGSVMCRELIDFDLSDPEQREKARLEGVHDKKCTVFIKNAVEILASLTEIS